jgi:hypothetical protein
VEQISYLTYGSDDSDGFDDSDGLGFTHFGTFVGTNRAGNGLSLVEYNGFLLPNDGRTQPFGIII